MFSVLNVCELIHGLTCSRNLKKQCMYLVHVRHLSQDFTFDLSQLISFETFFFQNLTCQTQDAAYLQVQLVGWSLQYLGVVLPPITPSPPPLPRAVTTLESRRPMRNSRRLCKQAPEARVTRGSGPPGKLKVRVAVMPFPAFSRSISHQKDNQLRVNNIT